MTRLRLDRDAFASHFFFTASSLWTQFKKSKLESREKWIRNEEKKSNKSSLDWKRFSPPLEGLCKAEKHTNKIKWDEKYLICKFFYFNFSWWNKSKLVCGHKQFFFRDGGGMLFVGWLRCHERWYSSKLFKPKKMPFNIIEKAISRM